MDERANGVSAAGREASGAKPEHDQIAHNETAHNETANEQVSRDAAAGAEAERAEAAGAGPLQGLRVLEFGGIGPAPFAAMMLGDAGADVIRLERPGGSAAIEGHDATQRSRRLVEVDLKSDSGRAAARRLIARADILLEGFRPGVMERLGFGPEACWAIAPKLVYGRMTGWGQTGPLAHTAGHDINYIALSGALEPIGTADAPPPPPLNLIGDYGGGGMLLAFGALAALVSAKATGRGQVVDAAMLDGAAALTTLIQGWRGAGGAWRDARGANILDGGAPYYRCYRCADGRFVAVGAIEPAFFAALLAGLGLQNDPLFAAQNDRALWPAQTERFAATFAGRSRDAWEATFAGTDACVTPALSLAEAPVHPVNAARGVFQAVGPVVAPAAAPRFSEGAPGARAAEWIELAEAAVDWEREPPRRRV